MRGSPRKERDDSKLMMGLMRSNRCWSERVQLELHGNRGAVGIRDKICGFAQMPRVANFKIKCLNSKVRHLFKARMCC